MSRASTAEIEEYLDGKVEGADLHTSPPASSFHRKSSIPNKANKEWRVTPALTKQVSLPWDLHPPPPFHTIHKQRKKINDAQKQKQRKKGREKADLYSKASTCSEGNPVVKNIDAGDTVTRYLRNLMTLRKTSPAYPSPKSKYLDLHITTCNNGVASRYYPSRRLLEINCLIPMMQADRNVRRKNLGIAWLTSGRATTFDRNLIQGNDANAAIGDQDSINKLSDRPSYG
ncbi:hypothetical protein BC829DRAFT_421821 [Chytridium lagenaria]|nr:hypothetical protein BC829DRAFT_421821 [Chytridium lagenaria]